MNDDEQFSDDKIIFKTPSMEVINKITTSKKNKIILTGVKRSGKTTTLKCLTSKNNDIIIYVDYRYLNYERGLNQLEYEYYYELLLAKKIIDFIKEQHYSYYKNIIIYDNFIQNKIKDFNTYLSIRPYAKLNIANFTKGMFINKINEILKQIVDVNTITLVIDHFDFVGDSSKRFQDFMINYFNMFDKVIITSNDFNLKDITTKTLIEEKGYQIIDVNYGKNITNVKKILLLYFKWWFNQINLEISNIRIINKIYQLLDNDEFCNNLIQKTDGNIEMMIDIIRTYFIQNCTIEEAIDVVIGTEKEINRVSFTKKLHI